MKIEGTILEECDLCHHINPSTYNHTCYGCGRDMCLVCLFKEDFVCSVCGGYYIEPAPF